MLVIIGGYWQLHRALYKIYVTCPCPLLCQGSVIVPSLPKQDSIMQNNGEHVEEPQNDSTGPIKSPKQLLVVVVLSFLIPISIIIMLVNLASISSTKGAGSTAQSDEAIAERLQPVAKFKLVDEEADEEVKSGEDVFKST